MQRQKVEEDDKDLDTYERWLTTPTGVVLFNKSNWFLQGFSHEWT